MQKKSKIVTIGIILTTILLAGIAVFTAIRLYQTRNTPVAPNVPSSKPAAAAPACSLSFTITVAPTQTPTAPAETASCTSIKIYSTATRTILSPTQLSNLKSGDAITLCTQGTSTGSGILNKAQFTINGTALAETTMGNSWSEGFCSSYTIPASLNTFNITSKLNHSSLGWTTASTGCATTFTIGTPPPPPPTNLTSSCPVAGTGNTIILGWTAGSANIDHYNLQIDDYVNGGWTGCTLPDRCVAVTGTSYQLAITGYHSFAWWVQAVAADGTLSESVVGSPFTCTPTEYTASPTSTSTATSTATTIATATATSNPQCNNSCTSNSNCPSGLMCYIASGSTTGMCRNTQCLSETDCTCATATNAPTNAPQASLPVVGTTWPTIFATGFGILVVIGSLLLAL